MKEEDFIIQIQEDMIYVAEYNSEIVGVLSILYRKIRSEHQTERNIIFVDTMVVDEPYIGKGVGHAFFDFLKMKKEELGCDAIELQVNAKNSRALEMYQNYGFTYKSINMELLE